MSRRSFLSLGAALTLGAAAPSPFLRAIVSRREKKLRLGIIGVANRGGDNLGALAGEDIAALCDVDENYLGAAAKRHGSAKTFVDFRELLDMKELDAVVISTPDHIHAPAAERALRRGLDVYCEKPLTHTVAEARLLARLAKEHGRVTQMGTQIHARENYRRVVELIRRGNVGEVRECHVFCNGKTWSGGDRPSELPDVPKSLHWDLWLGPAAPRPYHEAYHPAGWRRFWEFGGGTLADMGCHYMDLAFWALDLGHPVAVKAEGPPVHVETGPAGIAVSWSFPSRNGRAPVDLHWYDGNSTPPILATLGLERWRNGVLFVTEKGWVIADYDNHEIGPEAFAKEVVRPDPYIVTSIGHHAEWVAACRDRTTTTCSFDYSGPLTETVLLGIVAYRTGKSFEFDAASLRAKGTPEATALMTKTYRPGFEVSFA